MSDTEQSTAPQTVEALLWDMEERGWTGGAQAARAMTSKEAVFVFPFPVGILRGETVWQAPEVAQRWRSVVMGERSFSRKGSIAVLAYEVSAEREDTPIFEALCSSTYLKDDGAWLRLSHQQTPMT